MTPTGFRAPQLVSAWLMAAGLGYGAVGWIWAADAALTSSLVAGSVLLLAGAWQWHSWARAHREVSALHGELAMMASVAQHTGSPVVVTDNDMKVLWCNEAFERETGYTLNEVRGERSGRWLRSPHADPDTVEQLRSALRLHKDVDVELLHRYRDGKDRWIRVILVSQRNTRGAFCGYVSVLVDIDAQVRTREAYRQALGDREALMRTLEAYAIVAETDAQGRFTRVNQRFVDISGYSEAELIGKRFALLGSGWHTSSFWHNMWARIQRGQPWQGEICNRSQSGRLFWVQTMISPFVDENGQIEKFVAIQSDISEHRLARIELHRSQVLLARTSELAGVGGWHALPSAGALHMTPECRRLLGADGLSLPSLDDLWRVFDHGARLLVRRQLQELVERQRREVRLVAPVNQDTGASARWVRLVASYGEPDGDTENRAPARIVGAVQDFTPQVLTQQRIREEQRILHSAMDGIGGAFALFDAQKKLVYFNDEYAAWMPASWGPLQGSRHEDLLWHVARQGLFKESKGRESEWVQEVLKAPLKSEPDRVRQMANGRWIRFVDRVTADGYRVVFRYDVTELQDALIQADAAVQSKGQFLANMSHEIRTPINAMTGMLQLLADTPLNARQMDMVGKSRTAARSLLDIINDILDFSKIEAGMMQLDASPFRLADLQHELEVILSGARGSKLLDLVVEADPALPAVVVGDRVRLRQVLINLGGNALKFTEQGGVTLRWMLAGRTQGRVVIRFVVEDTGIGIAPELQASIFDSFSQGESSTTRRFGGSGLGLTISQRLVHFMGGHIGLTSTPGQGSTFFFEVTLPEGSESAVPAEEAVSNRLAGAPALQGVRILLAEDHALNQEVALALLAREGAQVTLVENGWLAVQALRNAPGAFDLVLMDLQMPVLDGLQATERIRGELGLADLPVIAMTANAMTSDRDNCLKAGMNAHIGKPFDIHEVVRVVQRFTQTGLVEPLGPAATSVTNAVANGSEVASLPTVLDDVQALRRLGGNHDLLDQLRSRFEEAALALMRQARTRAARGEWASAANAVHQLKGSAGVVGADQLAALCGEVESRCRAAVNGQPGSQCQGALDRLEKSLQAVLQHLPPQHRPAKEPGYLPMDDGSSPTLLAEEAFLDSLAALKPLKCLLDAADMEAIDAHEQWMQRHVGARDARFHHLNRCVEQMDLQAAAVACAGLLAPLEAVDIPIE